MVEKEERTGIKDGASVLTGKGIHKQYVTVLQQIAKEKGGTLELARMGIQKMKGWNAGKQAERMSVLKWYAIVLIF